MSDGVELIEATRHLMERSTVRADRDEDREAYGVIRCNATALREWFATYPRYDLTVEAGWARLTKAPLRAPGPALDAVTPHSGRPFDRRRYVWYCLALAAVDRVEERRVRLGILAEEIEALAVQGHVVAPNLDLQVDRMAIADVFRRLEDEGVVHLTDGSAQSFVDSTIGEALYEVDRSLAARLLAARRAPSACASPDELDADLYPPGREGETLRIRNDLWRRLLETAVVYYDTLSDAERQYLDSQRPSFARQLRDRVGLRLEVRAEGVAAVDPDIRAAAFPSATAGSVAMAVACVHRRLVDADTEAPGEPVPVRDLDEALVPVIAHPRTRREYREDDRGRDVLRDRAVALLERAGMARRSPGGVVPLPVLHRYVFRIDDATPASVVRGDADGEEIDA
ncbi:MAG TPA: TIGR02678 family protein [Candidatus Dormibacteraeota bacterium]|nr:TIGR02678 family protein [Candidatus Dormibacteraeota bacterium]